MFKKVGIFFYLMIFAVTSALAQSSGLTDDSTVIGGGARPLGMGKAFVAIADDADAMLINPAGIASLKAPQGMSMFTNLLNDVYYMEFTGAVPAPMGVLGIGYVSTGVKGIQEWVTTDEAVNTDYYDTLLAFSYSSPLARFVNYGRNIFVGASLKVYSRGFSGGVNQSATGLSADIGVKYVPSPYISFGFCRQNVLPVSLGGKLVWGSGAEESLAGIDKIGIAIRPQPFRRRLVLAYDIDFPAYSTRPVTMHFGTEWQIHDLFYLRGGFDQNLDSSTQSLVSWNPTYGMSFALANFRIDYAYHHYYNNPGLATTYVSLSLTGEPWLTLKGVGEPLTN